MRDNRRALVTGATGFIGSHLAKRLVADGWEVHAVVRPGSELGRLREIGVRAHSHDGSTDGLSGIIGDASPTVVFHLASLFLSQHRASEVVPLVRSNVEFGAQLLEGMAAHAVPALVNTGTSWQHFTGEGYNPVALYAATKEAFEAILAYYVETSPMRAITLKLFDTYGPHDPRPKLFSLLRGAVERDAPLPMSPGEQRVDLVYVDDVVNAFLLAAQRLEEGRSVRPHEVYAVSSGAPLPLRELVELFREVTGSPVPVEWGGRPYRAREVMVPWNAGVPLPGWAPRVGLREGIRRATEGR